MLYNMFMLYDIFRFVYVYVYQHAQERSESVVCQGDITQAVLEHWQSLCS